MNSNTSIKATEFRNRCFELLNLAGRGSEFVIEKDGRPTARLIPYSPIVPMEKIKETISAFKTVFSKIPDKKSWSTLETTEWKKREKKYLKNLPNKH